MCYFGTEMQLALFFFFNDTATTEIYPLSLHDALPISHRTRRSCGSTLPPGHLPSPWVRARRASSRRREPWPTPASSRSEEHTSELQSRLHLVCRLLLEKKNEIQIAVRNPVQFTF